MKCHYCNTPDGLRPYGPNGSPICFPCMKESPEREAAAEAEFGKQFAAAAAASEDGIPVIGHPAGPFPNRPKPL